MLGKFPSLEDVISVGASDYNYRSASQKLFSLELPGTQLMSLRERKLFYHSIIKFHLEAQVRSDSTIVYLTIDLCCWRTDFVYTSA